MLLDVITTHARFAIADSDYIIRIASAVALAILYYDYILTFSAEVALLASFIFYLNRYLTLFSHVLVLYELYRVSDENVWSYPLLNCHHKNSLCDVVSCTSGLQFFRLYALYRGSRRVISMVFAIFIVCCMISAWSYSQTRKMPSSYIRENGIPGVGCDLTITVAHILGYDLTVFILTMHRVLRVESRCRGYILTILMRDGEVLLVCHVCNISTCLSAYRGISVTTTNVTLMTRLMLNLRNPKLLEHQYRISTNLTEFLSHSDPISSLQSSSLA
ncbi:hypothetical protein BD310DRAFT_929814 [Dichomitus squalens]|uniref:Uncharacterized protein n=1 Tax=Dichomitus squalens TaxID=114155 RepID=A0A4Q9PRY7_9APHY|nr:hypothetical protein BD310DRAFT_929814 [Dichomitus squalens]